MRILGVIPARGGSKRIPRKNLRLLHGKPLIQYTIEAAQNASSLTTFVVSTEDEAVRDIATGLGAYVVRRPDELASDTATSGAVCCQALEWMESDNGHYDLVVLLHPTSPIRDPAHIDYAVERIIRGGETTLASAYIVPPKTHPNIWAFVGEDKPHLVTSAAVYNGSIYVLKRDWLKENKKHVNDSVGEQVAIFIMDKLHSVDIDDEIDFKIAECLLDGFWKQHVGATERSEPREQRVRSQYGEEATGC